MNNKPGGEVTQLLLQWRAGDEAALAALLPLVYEELRSLARRHLRHERGSHTLQRKETADIIGVSPATVKREWAIARAWLQREIMAGEGA